MKKRSFMQWPLALAACALVPAVQAQAFPSRPVRVVVPFAAGNTLDSALRQVAEEFKKNTGQPMLVDNKPGGSGIIAAQTVMNAPADGYTLLLTNTSMLAINPFTFSKLPYDAQRSFKSVTGFVGASMVLAVHANVPANNVKEFLTWARRQTDPVSYASFTAGNSSHFAGVILNQRTGLQLVHVPFNGTPPAVQNLVGGQVNAAFLPLLAVKPHVESGKVKVLAVTSPLRSPLMPTVPTFKEQGFPDLEIYIWSGISAPAGTPDATIQRLNAELGKVLRSAELREKWRALDFESLPMTPDEFNQFVQADARRWSEAVSISGFKASE
ncbi:MULTISPECIES: tripartite tricarboxylate transporter substrate binding protein [unclassified Acidovorax]|uniref:Bug family tripartite tricarboxylate transporter substrate binding protein n=1 Tax=unclassified Acidovorax TaxID=2684926 RepID=UPI000C64F03E|nr:MULTISPECIES: tripartite tricarboxylate transporter substrate binding protein [unclassified Acidovorax]PIF17620.1 tripartite-type tricarboxylate transporter receptor subunit TctC [Acidovorax sp. 59]PKW03356.1 tripartite-type tricarboxylate transporter receptor subunit TctC [Acidovorax sp. 30]